MISKSVIKYIQSLQQKKFRDEHHAFTAEGPKVVSGIIESGVFPLKAVYALQEWADESGKLLLQNHANKLEVVKDFELEKLASYTTPNKVVAVFEKKQAVVADDVSDKFTLVLDDIQDPGNLGTIIRTADWFGIEHIVCSPATADMYNSKVVQSTMASLGMVNVVYTDIHAWLKKQKGIKIFAATLHGKPISNYEHVNEGILVIGNESKGVSEAVMKLANEKITIPKIGHAESLNAAVAAGIMLAKFCGKI